MAFLARKTEIAKSVAAGHQLNTIYADLEKALGISYSQFARYVKKYITGSTEFNGNTLAANQTQKPLPAPLAETTGQRQPQPSRQPTGTGSTTKPTTGFHHDPIAAKKLDDLV